MTSYIRHFNASIKGMLKQNASNGTLAIIERYRKQRNNRDYYQTLDNLGLRVGIEYLVQPVWDEETGNPVSFISCLKFHEGNPITGKFAIIDLSEFKSVNKAYAYVAKEHVYRLMEISNLEESV